MEFRTQSLWSWIQGAHRYPMRDLPSLSVGKIRYSSPQTLRKYILQTRPEGQEPLKFSETAFPDLIRDPFPAIAEIVRSIIRNYFFMISIVRALMVCDSPGLADTGGEP